MRIENGQVHSEVLPLRFTQHPKDGEKVLGGQSDVQVPELELRVHILGTI